MVGQAVLGGGHVAECSAKDVICIVCLVCHAAGGGGSKRVPAGVGTRKQLVVFFGNAGIATRGGWGAKAVLQACRKVVERPNSGKPTDRVPGKVVTVNEFRTNRVSSTLNSPQPCEEELDSSKPTRPENWKPKPGQATPGDLGKWVDRDCNAALNLQRAGESKWRPLELCGWPHRGRLPAQGKEYPALGFKKLAFPWCTCSDYAIGSSPYSLSLFSTTTSATNITATFVVNALDTPARPSTCFNILQDNGVEKIELASSISCLRNVRVLINGLPSSASGIDMPANFRTKANVKAKFVPALTSNSADGTLITSFGPGRQVMKLVNLFLDFDTADGVEVTITLNRSGLCPTWNTFFRGAYAIFNSDMKCCPRGDLAQP
ncbi:hypothetical protein QJQ45_003094 [Haematococcus lacustris]|nr:hypothetical protein QJQ45_003094 [Haematococcus lacustris]